MRMLFQAAVLILQLHVLVWGGCGAAAAPPLLSRRADALAGGGWDVNVSDAGDITLSARGPLAQVRFNVVSAFSEAGPRWNSLGDVSGMPTMGDGGSRGPTELSSGIETRPFDVQVDRSAAALDGRWVVRAEIREVAGTRPSFSLVRVVQLDPPPPALPLKVLALSLSLSLSLSLCLCLSLSHTHTHTLSLSLSPSLSHTHTYTLCRSRSSSMTR